MYKMTLAQWQMKLKHKEKLLYNCSECDKLNDEWVNFPIGMCYQFINYDGDIMKTQIGLHQNIVLCAVSKNTDKRRRFVTKNRESILNTLKNNDINNIFIDASNYFDLLPSYKFIISPEGNGIDCHRHYEALMAGCIPIVENHPGIKEKYGDCPILYTDDYSEITIQYLKKKYDEMINKEYDFSRLFINNYDQKTQNEIKKNGNYWSCKLTGKKWYNY